MIFDATDAKILALLQVNSRLTMEEIGEHVNLSPTAIVKRLKSLRQKGVIEGNVAVLSLDAIAPFVSTLVLCSFDGEGAATIDDFTRAILSRPEVTNAWIVTGEVDVIFVIMTRTIDEYSEHIRALQRDFPQLTKVRTLVVLKQVKRSLAVPPSLIGA